MCIWIVIPSGELMRLSGVENFLLLYECINCSRSSFANPPLHQLSTCVLKHSGYCRWIQWPQNCCRLTGLRRTFILKFRMGFHNAKILKVFFWKLGRKLLKVNFIIISLEYWAAGLLKSVTINMKSGRSLLKLGIIEIGDYQSWWLF